MKSTGWFIIVVCLVVTTACSLKDQAKIDIQFQLGISSLAEGNCTEALRHLIEAHSLDDEDHEIQNALGLSYLCKDQFEKAIEHFTRATQLKPDYPQAYNTLCVSYLRMSRWEKAIEFGRIAAENLLYSSPERAHLNIGWAYYNLGDYQKAVEYYNKALKVLPNWCLARYNLAMVGLKTHNYNDATYHLGKAIEKCPVYTEAYEAMGDALYRNSQPQKAKEYYLKCYSLAPESSTGRDCRRKANFIR